MSSLQNLTFITDSSARRTPNPNVMLEYGYALHALGDGKIVGVFNEAHGSPENLPFDLAHRRWPIRFNLSDESDKDHEKKSLKGALVRAMAQASFLNLMKRRLRRPPLDRLPRQSREMGSVDCGRSTTTCALAPAPTSRSGCDRDLTPFSE